MGTAVALILFGMGILALVLRRDLVIKLLALGLVNAASILFLISIGDRPGALPPIQLPGDVAILADPLPQALVLSAIVVNFAILALALVFVMILCERFHSTDSMRIEQEIAREVDGEEPQCH